MERKQGMRGRNMERYGGMVRDRDRQTEEGREGRERRKIKRVREGRKEREVEKGKE